jgi:hypothetical protein
MRRAAGAQATKHDTGTATTRPITSPNETRGKEIDLPRGVTASDIIGRREALAAELRRRTSRTFPEVRALSLWRPWPYLILHAGKDVENRTWGTGYRGLLVLHAGKVIARPALAEIQQGDGAPLAAVLACGFVGVAELVEVHAAVACYDRHGPELCSPWAAADGWHWRLSDPRPFPTAITGPGRQRLFIPPPAAVAEVMR